MDPEDPHSARGRVYLLRLPSVFQETDKDLSSLQKPDEGIHVRSELGG